MLVQALNYSSDRHECLLHLAIEADRGRVIDPVGYADSAEFEKRLYILELVKKLEALRLSRKVDITTLTLTLVIEAAVKTGYEQALLRSMQEDVQENGAH
ncbi:hypothetical protein LTR86_010136 [Recurvomyces mirabilis]|nr:hypothetical protein LTR86_010136 [Recurvomyces mirabilis]